MANGSGEEAGEKGGLVLVGKVALALELLAYDLGVTIALKSLTAVC